MRPSEALETHRVALRELMQRYRMLSPRIFGSVLTGKDDDESDLDLLVDYPAGTTLFTLGALQEDAETLLGVPVSICSPSELHPKFREEVVNVAQPL